MNEKDTTSRKESEIASEFGCYQDIPKVEDTRAKIAEIRQIAKDLEKKQKNNN
ncbi:hypothetical protein COTS27_01323 [Spirochaetota bacterium]|nr:hypothetical protein COTS27_01323 [Spirochaetota bacterium]